MNKRDQITHLAPRERRERRERRLNPAHSAQ